MVNVMHIIEDEVALPGKFADELASRGVSTQRLSPTLLGAFTAVKIASALGKENIHCIHAYNLRDAMSAISGREISKGVKPKIVVEVAPNSAVPKSIPADICAGVDAWIFPSKRLLDLYPDNLKCKTLLPPVDLSIDWQKAKPNPSANHLCWVGALDGNIDRLKTAIQIVDDNEGLSLRVCGTGKARYVMEAVRKQRGMEHPERVEWLGENFDIAEVLSGASAIVQAGLDPCGTESQARGRGWQLLQVSGNGFSDADIELIDSDKYFDNLTSLYFSLR